MKSSWNVFLGHEQNPPSMLCDNEIETMEVECTASTVAFEIRFAADSVLISVVIF